MQVNWNFQTPEKGGDPAAGAPTTTLLRLSPPRKTHLKHFPPLRVWPVILGASCLGGLTGGVYKAREHIHRGVADPRLLAIPTSWRRVSASNLNWDRFSGFRSISRLSIPLYRPL